MVPHFRLDLVVSDGKSGFSPVAVPRSLAKAGSSSRRLYASSEHCRPVSAPRLSTSCHAPCDARGAPSLGFAFPLRDISCGRPCDGGPVPPPFRPRRFSRPRRFAPPSALWVYFTPQPRPGFALQGVSLEHSRDISSIPRALSSLTTFRCKRLLACAAARRPALRALLRVRVRCRIGGF